MATRTDAVPPAKRARLEDSEALLDTPDEEVWFSDGNIIVAAVDDVKNRRHLFKCHRGLLAKRLPALGDMFEAGIIAGSASASEQFDGHPVVRLYDRHEHLKALLRALYDPSSVFLIASLSEAHLSLT